jgi:eukaryotic-like serine/threonine-protein kinase
VPALFGRERRSPVIVLVVAILAIAVGLYYRSPQQTRFLTEKDTIVLADFSNSTGDAIFNDTLKTALSVSLRQSPFLSARHERRAEARRNPVAWPAWIP